MEEASVTLTRKEYKEKADIAIKKFMDVEIEKATSPLVLLATTLAGSIVMDLLEEQLFGKEKENN